MKSIKVIFPVMVILLLLGAVAAGAYAASGHKTPAEVVAGLTGRSLDSVLTERRETGKTCGEMAADAGKLEEFRKEKMEIKKENLNARVAEGKISREQAGEMLKAMERHQANCDGSGPDGACRGLHERFGFGGNDRGAGQGPGCNGHGANAGHGHGRCKAE